VSRDYKSRNNRQFKPRRRSNNPHMNHDTWQQLLSLESRDIVVMWFVKIHARELNARRAKEITAGPPPSKRASSSAIPMHPTIP